MTKKIEKEIKLLGKYNNQLKFSSSSLKDSLSKIETLLDILKIKHGNIENITQIDEYYDTYNNKLLNEHASLRIRYKGKRVYLTIKKMIQNEDNVLPNLSRSETEIQLKSEKIEDVVNKYGKEVLDIKPDELLKTIQVNNIRNVIPIQTNIRKYELCFDKYYFYIPNENKKSEDYYEIEIETNNLKISDDEQLVQLTRLFIETWEFIENLESKYERGRKWIANTTQQYLSKQFIVFDIVKYSKRQSYIQKDIILEFNRIVEEKLEEYGFNKGCIKIPTGDGMIIGLNEKCNIILFISSIIKKIKFINKNCQEEKRIDIRTAIHFGSIFEYQDINNYKNYAGIGINIACRIIGEAKNFQVLVSEEFYQSLFDQGFIDEDSFSEQFEIKVKHGVCLKVRNYYNEYSNVGIPNTHININ